jgi:putative flippase GtrA
VSKKGDASLVLESIRNWIWRELAVATRFGLVGITATCVHILIVWLLLSKTLLPTLVANMLAFLTAFGISFTGNYLWTFGSPGHPGKAMRRFLMISVSAFAVNSLLLAWLLTTGWLAPTASAIVSATAIPAITFWASRLWGFKLPNGNGHHGDSLTEEPQKNGRG